MRPKVSYKQRLEERRDDALGPDMESQDDFEWLNHSSECIERLRNGLDCGDSSPAFDRIRLEAAAGAALGLESDKEWAEARANLLSYVRLLREWQERSKRVPPAQGNW